MTVAGIRPTVTKIRPGDADLARITGARTPSGVPVALAVPAAAQPAAQAASADGKGADGKSGSPRRRPGKRSGLPTDVDMNGNPRRPRPKQRLGAAGQGERPQAAGFIGRSSGRARPGSGSKSGGNYGTGRQRRKFD